MSRSMATVNGHRFKSGRIHGRCGNLAISGLGVVLFRMPIAPLLYAGSLVYSTPPLGKIMSQNG